MNLDLEGCIPFSPFPWLLHYNIDKVFVHIRVVLCLLSLVINKVLDGYENPVDLLDGARIFNASTVSNSYISQLKLHPQASKSRACREDIGI